MWQYHSDVYCYSQTLDFIITPKFLFYFEIDLLSKLLPLFFPIALLTEFVGRSGFLVITKYKNCDFLYTDVQKNFMEKIRRIIDRIKVFNKIAAPKKPLNTRFLGPFAYQNTVTGIVPDTVKAKCLTP